MKILQINKFFFLNGGVERYFFDLAELLESNGHKVCVFSTKHPKNFPFPEEGAFANYYDLTKSEGFFKDLKKIKNIFWNSEASKKLEEVIKKEKPDVAHLHNIFSHLSPSIIYTLKKNNIPIVMTLHDYKLFCPSYLFFNKGKECQECLKNKNFHSCVFKKCIKKSYIKSLIGYLEAVWQKNILKVAKKIDIFIAPSLFVERKAKQDLIPKEKIVHIPHFINNFLEEFIFKKNESEKYFLFFGRLIEEKGVKQLIKVFLNILKKYPDFKLKIAGDGNDIKRLKFLAKKNSKIEFLGHKNKKELNDLIYSSYAVVVPSLFPETFCLSVAEAIILGKFVIASKIGAIPELIKDKKTGILFKPGNIKDMERKISWAIENPLEIEKIGKEARKKVLDKFNAEDHYKKIIKIYERIKNN